MYEGRIYFSQKKFDKSKSSFANVLSNDQNNSDGLYYQGLYYLFFKEYEECKTQMKRMCKTDAKSFNAKMCLALSDLFLQNFDDAISIYKQLIKLKPNHLMLNYHLALCYLKKKEYTAASETCKIILEIDKKFGYVYLLQSFLHYENNNQNKIEKISEKLYSLNIDKKFYIKNTLFSAMAKRHLNKDVNSNSDFEAIQLLESCKSMVKTGDNPNLFEEMEAIVYYKTMILFKINKTNEFVYKIVLHCLSNELPFKIEELEHYRISNFVYFIGYLYLKLNNDLEALKFFDFAVKLDKTNPHYYIAQLIQLMRQENYDQAIQLASKCVKKFETKQNAQLLNFYLAFCITFKGDLNEAAIQLRFLTPIDLHSSKMIEEFIKNDLKYECQTKRFYFQIDKANEQIESEFCLRQTQDFTKFKISNVEIECDLNFGIFFNFRCVSYLLFQAHIEFNKQNYPEVKHLLNEAKALDNYRIVLYRAVSEKVRNSNTRIKRQPFPMCFVFG